MGCYMNYELSCPLRLIHTNFSSNIINVKTNDSHISLDCILSVPGLTSCSSYYDSNDFGSHPGYFTTLSPELDMSFMYGNAVGITVLPSNRIIFMGSDLAIGNGTY